MNIARFSAIALIAIGLLSLVYGGFTYTKVTSRTEIGALHLSWTDHESVKIPVWIGVAGVVIGSSLLLRISTRKSS